MCAQEQWVRGPDLLVGKMQAAAGAKQPLGRLIVAGGRDVTDANHVHSKTCQISSSPFSTWASSSSMLNARRGQIASRYSKTTSNMPLLAIAGMGYDAEGNSNPIPKVEQTPTGTSYTWSSYASLRNERVDLATATQKSSNTIYAICGDFGINPRSCERNTNNATTWTIGNYLGTYRDSFAATDRSDTQLIVTGGSVSSTSAKTTELLSTTAGSWSAGPAMLYVRDSHGIFHEKIGSDQVLVAGGYQRARGTSMVLLMQTERLPLGATTWIAGPTLPYHHGACGFAQDANLRPWFMGGPETLGTAARTLYLDYGY